MKSFVTCLWVLMSSTLLCRASPSSRIVGGDDTDIRVVPYQAAVRVNGVFVCGGSIISTKRILTAAKCISNVDPSTITVRVGSSRLGSGGRVVSISQTRVHEFYDPTNNFNDIGVLLLASSLNFTDSVRPVVLAGSDPAPGSDAFLAGWGSKSSSGPVSQILQSVSLNTISLNQCAASYTPGAVSTGNLCTAGSVGRGACLGDAGGALVANGVQVGLVSWGIPCARGIPDVFTSVTFYRSWIAQAAGV